MVMLTELAVGLLVELKGSTRVALALVPVTGQTVVATAITEVSTTVDDAGHETTVGPQEVMVRYLVE